MELPFRPKGDELLAPGAMRAVRERLALHSQVHDLKTVAAYAFDHRTRMLPFYAVDRRMSPGGVRVIGAALSSCGFEKTRVVLQTWNRNFRPSEARFDGELPDLFLASSMSIHSGRMKDMLRDICRIAPEQRPLVITGGPHMYYMPWDAFSDDPADPFRPDLAITGELYVFLEFLDALLTERAAGEPLRQTFLRAKARGAFDGIPGLVYPVCEEGRVPEALVDTGIQRLLQDLDELPHPVHGYAVLEAPSRKRGIANRPIDPQRVRKHSPIMSLEMTYGCKFRCPYCPIPAYNQHKDRQKSPERIADEMSTIYREYGIKNFFGSDDNFFNRHPRAISILETLSETNLDDGRRLGKVLTLGSEVTVHDTLQMKPHLRLARRAGVRMLWLGVEDMTATFVRKGQSVDKTREAFEALSKAGINPMPMLMHDDTQPLLSFGSARGLINQVQLLRGARALTVQVLALSPAPGSKINDDLYTGTAYKSVNGREVEPHLVDGNHVVASNAKRPWTRQINIVIAYAYFYNPLRLLKALVLPKNRRGHFADAFFQMVGMVGLIQNIRRTPRWLWHLMRGKIERHTAPPSSAIPFRSVEGERASHDPTPPAAAPKEAVEIGS